MSLPDDLATALTPLVRELDRLGVRYLVGGSVASAAHGEFRATNDVDLLAELSEEHVAPLVAALQTEYYASQSAILDAVQRQATFHVIHLDTMLKVDVFVSSRTAHDASALARTIIQPMGPGSAAPNLRLASAEDIVLAKLRWFRDGGETSERQWRDVLGVLRIQAARLDVAYLRAWSAPLGIEDLLQRALDEAGGA